MARSGIGVCVKLMLAAGCGLSAQCGLVKTEDFAALVQSLTALTALRKLDMHCESLFGLSFKGSYRVQATLMFAAGNFFDSDSGAALGRSLTALTALQILNLSSET